jgi:EmrB/QacA subfamily drug resistance transporter
MSTERALPSYWTVVLTASGANFLAMLDSTVTMLAVPALHKEFPAATLPDLSWVMSAYAILFAALLAPSGRLADTMGRKRILLGGIALFTVASLLCALAPTLQLLIAARAVQGIGAAIMVPASLSVLLLDSPPARRVMSISLLSAAGAAAAAVGPSLGGLLVEAFSWHAVFLINVPIGLLALTAAPRFVPESRAAVAAPLDGAGVLLLSIALIGLLYPLVEGIAAGWPAWATISLIASACAFAAFPAWERRLAGRGGAPLLPPALIGEPGFRLGASAVVAFYAANAGLFLVLAYHLQAGLELTALDSGLVFCPLGAGFAATSLRAGRLIDRHDPRVLTRGAGLMALGVVGAGAAVAWSSAPNQPWTLLPGLLLVGLGGGLVASPLIRVVLGTTRPHEAGAASGALLTLTQTANALGVALLGILFAATLGARPESPQARVLPVSSFTHAFLVSLAAVLALTILTGTALRTLTRQSSASPQPTEPSPRPTP